MSAALAPEELHRHRHQDPVRTYVKNAIKNSGTAFRGENSASIAAKLLIYNLFPQRWREFIGRSSKLPRSVLSAQLDYIEKLPRFNSHSADDWWHFLCLLSLGHMDKESKRLHHKHHRGVAQKSDKAFPSIATFFDSISEMKCQHQARGEAGCACTPIEQAALPLYLAALSHNTGFKEIPVSSSFIKETGISSHTLTSQNGFSVYQEQIASGLTGAAWDTAIAEACDVLFLGEYNTQVMGFDLTDPGQPAVQKQVMQKRLKEKYQTLDMLNANSNLDLLKPEVRNVVASRINGGMNDRLGSSAKMWLEAEMRQVDKAIEALQGCQMTESERLERLRVKVKAELARWKTLKDGADKQKVHQAAKGFVALQRVPGDLDRMDEAGLLATNAELAIRSQLLAQFQE